MARYRLADVNPTRADLERQLAASQQIEGGQYGGMLLNEEGLPLNMVSGGTRNTSGEQVSASAAIQEIINLLDKYGVNDMRSLPMEVQRSIPGVFSDTNSSVVGGLLSSPAFLLAAGGIGAMYAAPAAGAGAAAGEGAATAGGLTAAEEAAMLTGSGVGGGGAATTGAGYGAATTTFDELVTGGDAAWGVNQAPAELTAEQYAAGLSESELAGSTFYGNPDPTYSGFYSTTGETSILPGEFTATTGATTTLPGETLGSYLTADNLARLYNQYLGSQGGSGGGLGDTVFNAAPAVAAIALANSQRKDIDPFLGQLSSLSSQYQGNQPAYLKSITDPYDLATGQRRAELMQNHALRGIGGSSFADQSLNNFDYMSGVGRGNLLAQGINQGTGTQAGLIGQQIQAVNNRNLASNALIGAGLGASARLFSPTPNPFSDLFGLSNLWQGN